VKRRGLNRWKRVGERLLAHHDDDAVVVVVGKRLHGVALRLSRDAAGLDALLDEDVLHVLHALVGETLVDGRRASALVSIADERNLGVGVLVGKLHNGVDFAVLNVLDVALGQFEEDVLGHLGRLHDGLRLFLLGLGSGLRLFALGLGSGLGLGLLDRLSHDGSYGSSLLGLLESELVGDAGHGVGPPLVVVVQALVLLAHIVGTGLEVEAPVLGDVEVELATDLPGCVPAVATLRDAVGIVVNPRVGDGQVEGGSGNGNDVDQIVAVGEEHVRQVEHHVEIDVADLALVFVTAGQFSLPRATIGLQAQTEHLCEVVTDVQRSHGAPLAVDAFTIVGSHHTTLHADEGMRIIALLLSIHVDGKEHSHHGKNKFVLHK